MMNGHPFIGESLSGSMTTLYYDFDDFYNFDYEADEYDEKAVIDDFIKQDPKYAAELLLDEQTDEDIDFLTSEGFSLDIKNNTIEQNMELIKECMEPFTSDELIDIFLLYDDLKAYCEEEAREMYEDGIAEQRDPYSYFGVKRSDFS